MMDIKLGIAHKAPWETPFFKARDRMGAWLRISAHFLAGAVLAAYLAPEGAAIGLGCLTLAAGMKALYDYFDRGVVGICNAAAIVVGGILALGIAMFV